MTTYWLSDNHMDSSVTSVEHDDSMKPRQVKFEQTMTPVENIESTNPRHVKFEQGLLDF